MALEANQPETHDLPADGAVYEDGNITDTSTQEPARQAPAQQDNDSGEKAEPQVFVDTARNEIFARAKEKRAAESQEYSGDPNDPDALYGSNVNQDDLGPLEREALQRRKDYLAGITGQQQEGQQAPARGKPLNGLAPELLATPVPIIVDGEARNVTMEDLIRNYQIDQAADKRLAAAKLLVRSTEDFNRLRPQPGQSGEQNDQPGQDNPDRDHYDGDGNGNTSRNRLADKEALVEKIQLGSPEEAADAIEQFIAAAQNRSAPIDDTTRVLTAIEDQSSRLAVTAFAEKNPQLVNNPFIAQAATAEIHKGMANDLLAAGYTMDQLRELVPGPKELTQLHKQARIQKLKGVRTVDQLVSAGYQGAYVNLRSTLEQLSPAFAAPNQAPSMAQRQQRKESLQPQPVVRRLSPMSSSNAPAASQEQARSAAVERMRKARGQSV